MDGEDVIEAKQLAVSDEAARPARDDAFWETTALSVRAFSADAAEPSRPSATSGAPDPSPGPPAASVPATLPPATLPDGLSSAEGGTASSVPSAEESGAGSSGAGIRPPGQPAARRRARRAQVDVCDRSVADLARRRPSGARRQGQRERAAESSDSRVRRMFAPSRQGRANGEPMVIGTSLSRVLDAMDGRSDFALAAGPHACEVLRPSAFTVTGIARDSHPHSPRQARSARPPVPPPTQPSLPFVDEV